MGCKMGCKNQKDCAENCVRLVHNGNRAYGSIDSLSGNTFVEIVPSGAGRFNAGTISHSLKNLQAGKNYLVHFLLARRPDKTQCVDGASFSCQDQLQANVKIGDRVIWERTGVVLDTKFKRYTAAFKASESAKTLTFEVRLPSGDTRRHGTVLLDAVKVYLEKGH